MPNDSSRADEFDNEQLILQLAIALAPAGPEHKAMLVNALEDKKALERILQIGGPLIGLIVHVALGNLTDDEMLSLRSALCTFLHTRPEIPTRDYNIH